MTINDRAYDLWSKTTSVLGLVLIPNHIVSSFYCFQAEVACHGWCHMVYLVDFAIRKRLR